MKARTLTYKKRGFDIIAHVSKDGDEAKADILYKPYGESEYIAVGEIYETLTSACGRARDTSTWHHIRGLSPIMKTTWYEAAINKYDQYRSEIWEYQ